MRVKRVVLAAALALAAGAACAQPLPPGPDLSDMVAHAPVSPGADYVQREVMIPMRDGVKLFTVIVVPKGASHAPILLTRTPYDAAGRVKRNTTTSMVANLSQSDELFAADGYIRVFQDIRGKYGSEGDYVMTRPPRGRLNPTATDDSTDAWDTIDWLIKNVPETNGRVGMIGSSYEGWTVVMALLDPHPALKVAAPESPMVDGWMGDDWFHYGAFRQPNLDYITGQTTKKGEGSRAQRDAFDDYQGFLRAGSVDGWASAHGVAPYPWLERMEAHAAYDGFWQGQALDHLLAAHPSAVPTMWEQGLWDQEDMWGAIHSWTALTAAGHGDSNYLVMGPWRHSGANYDGTRLGPLEFTGDTALEWRRDVLKPFFDQYLKDGAPRADTPRVFIYNTGENHWDRFAAWPPACERGCPAPLTALYLQPGFGLGFQPPAADAADAYVSDPAKPVPYLTPPVRFDDTPRWQSWLVSDQRPAAARPDVLVYETAPLDHPTRISGAPIADIWAVTTGTDGDFVVKLIDVYPDLVPSHPEMSGYELPIALDIFRGRYRTSFEHPSPIPPGKPQRYRFALPTANHVFEPGHRIMVQIQSTLFPLYDRNPQKWVANIFLAQPADYQPATIRILRSPTHATAVWLPLVR
ncbi:MAG TPA: CocE/NonD family hydrolase [Caulobacteraceae bacterium]|nr:CocE/NonD family hydrolase [Caulobacteraceae bacterium]